MKSIPASLALLFAVMGTAIAENPEPSIIPAVQSWEGDRGVCTLSNRVLLIDVSQPGLANLARMLVEDIEQVSGTPYAIQESSPGTNLLRAGSIHLALSDEVPQAEGYRLTIGEGVLVEARTTDGLFYGTRSLLQLMAQDSQALPRGRIIDYPDYRVRSLMWDVGRKFMPYEQLKDWVRVMSYVKLNELHLHLNDTVAGIYPGFRLELKTLPGLTSQDGFYTQEQMVELQAFAKERGLTIVPEIDAPAHATAFTTYRPDLAHPQLSPQDLDLTNTNTVPLLEQVFDEVCDVFDSEHIHIGTDELRLGGISDKEKRTEVGELFRKYINHMSEYLGKRGRTVRVWSGFEHMPGQTQPNTNVVVDMWTSNDAAAKAEAGYRFINSSHGRTYIVPFTPIYGISNKGVYNSWAPNIFSNKKGGTIPKDTPGLLGGKFHIWNDNGYQYAGYSHNEIARLAMPSLLVFAEKLWGRKGSASFAEFQARANKAFPGDDGFQFAEGSKSRHNDKDPMLGAFPGTTFLERDITLRNAESGLVWKLDEPRTFMPGTSLALEIPGTPDHLAYPWTATFTVTRYSDVRIGWYKEPHAHETLMDSRLCTLYLDYTFYAGSDKTTGLPTARNQGICLVRAARAPAASPSTSINHSVAYFGYKVPVGKKVTLTFVGQKGYTELYVDGMLKKRVNIQCLCPLKSVGASAWHGSFHGRLHEATIFNRAIPPAPKK